MARRKGGALRRFRLAIVGCGDVSRLHAEAYVRYPGRIEVVAACDPDLGRARDLAGRFCGCRA